MKTIKALNEWLCRLENLVNSVALVAVMIVISLQIIMRYVFNRPLLWSEELSRYLYVWIAWLGCAFCVGSRSHVSVPILFDILPPRVQKILAVIGNLVIAGVLCYLIPNAVSYALGQNSFTASTMPVKRIWLFITLPVGLVLTTAQLLLDTLIRIMENRREGGAEL